jgi:hypothetical protein
MSNTTQESQVFIPMTDTLSTKNSKLVLVDGAQGGQDIDIIIHDTAAFWTNINKRLLQAGLTPEQVQVVWFKEAQKGPTDTSFATYPDALKAKFKTAIQIIKSKFPNTRLCYLTSRIYAGYASSTLNPEPYAYYSGWSVKRLIEDQINGDTALAYAGASPKAPWLAWGPYPWADGTTSRSDGLTWICPTDYISDGTHPSTQGRQKVADMLMQFFTTDATAKPWFLKQVNVGVPQTAANTFEVYPQPATEHLIVAFGKQAVLPQSVIVLDATGRLVLTMAVGNNAKLDLPIAALSPGLYLLRAGNAAQLFVKQ